MSKGLPYRRLSQYLRILGQPTRLAILHKLQLPHTVSEIKVPPEGGDRSTISRQAVGSHVRKLESVGLIDRRTAERGGREVTQYLVDHARLFTVIEELRRISRIRPPPSLSPEATASGDPPTVTGPTGKPAALPDEPALVLAGGPVEGRAYPLEGEGPWTIGRAPDNDIPLLFDPFVSQENSEVQAGEDLSVEDLGSRHGTYVNWSRVAAGAPVPVASGDVLRVGRTLLVVRGV